eukprot:GFYU01006327.1.p1 GENE.GFYU01006327.1~~GFYU01006327.1.p1  ORF type:complete len:357 (+),score=74.21 GFYU01006327.1:131-1072(+)
MWGSPDSENKLLGLHGHMDNSATFDNLAPLILQEYQIRDKDVHFVCVDFSGHGLSGHRAGGNYAVGDYASDIVDAAVALGWWNGETKFDIMAHSMGGVATMIASAAFPEKIRRIVLLDTIGPWTLYGRGDPVAAVRNNELARLKWVDRNPKVYPTFTAAVEARMRDKMLPVDLTTARNLVRRGARPNPSGDEGIVFTHDVNIARFGNQARASQEANKKFFQAIKAQTIVILSSNGWVTVPKRYEVREQAFELDVTQLVVVDGKHHVHSDLPERVLRPVVEHLLGTDEEVAAARIRRNKQDLDHPETPAPPAKL